jgi:hypothetical protein
LGYHRNTIRNHMNKLTMELPNHLTPDEYFKAQLLTHLLSKP